MSREEIKAKVRKFVGGPELHIHDTGRFVDGIVDMVLDDALSDATVERAARALDPKAWDEDAVMFVAHSQSPEDARASRQRYACADARRVLAAAVKEER